MIEELIVRTHTILPLEIERAQYCDETLLLGGEYWSLCTLGAWRIIQDGHVLTACWDKNSDIHVGSLAHHGIVRVVRQSVLIGLDPAFELSDGRTLEIFSCDTFEPWVLKLPDGAIYTGFTN